MSKELGKTERPQIAASPSARPGAGKTAHARHDRSPADERRTNQRLRLTRPVSLRPATTQPVCMK